MVNPNLMNSTILRPGQENIGVQFSVIGDRAVMQFSRPVDNFQMSAQQCAEVARALAEMAQVLVQRTQGRSPKVEKIIKEG